MTVDEVLKDRRNRRIRPDEQLVVVEDEHGALLKALLERVLERLLETEEDAVGRAEAEAREKGGAQAPEVRLRAAFKPREAGASLSPEEFTQQRGLPDAAWSEDGKEFESVRGEALFERLEFP